MHALVLALLFAFEEEYHCLLLFRFDIWYSNPSLILLKIMADRGGAFEVLGNSEVVGLLRTQD